MSLTTKFYKHAADILL